MTCPVCGADNETGSAFCYRCGSALKPTPGATGPTVNLGSAPPNVHEPEGGARVYDVAAQPAQSVPSEPLRSSSGPATAPMDPGLPTGGYTPPANSMPTYTVPSSVGTTAQQSNSALISMILGITSLVLFVLLLCVFFLSPLSAVAGIPAVILGRNARREIKASGGQLTGDGMAVAGIIMGWINIGLSLLMLCGTIAFFAVLAGGLAGG